MSDAPDTRASIGLVGGNALPGGVMMRTSRRVGIAVRQEATGGIVTEGFDLDPPSGRWLKLPLARGILAMRTAISIGKEAMLIGDRLRWAEPVSDDADAGEPPEDEPLGWGAKVLMVVGAAIGILVQLLAFRVAPIVIAKQAGLTGAEFIVADAAIRLALLLGTLLLMSMLRPFRRILSYHGAEHQAIAAYEAGAPLDRCRRRRLHALSSALRDLVPGRLGDRVDRRVRRGAVGDWELQLPRADHDANRAGPGGDGDRVRDPASGCAPLVGALALPLGTGDVGAAPDHPAAGRRGARGRRRRAA